MTHISIKKLTTYALALGVAATFAVSGASAQGNNGRDKKASEQKTERKAPPLQQQQPQQKRVEAQRQQPQRQVQPQPVPPQRVPPQRQVWAQQQQQQQKQIQAQQQQRQIQVQQQNQIRQAQQRQITEQNRQIQLQNAQKQQAEDKRLYDQRIRNQQTQTTTDWRQNQNGRRTNTQRIVPQPNTRLDRDQQEALRRQRLTQYNQHWNNWQNISKVRYLQLQQERRNAYLSYQQRYWERLRRDQLRLQQARYYDNYYNNYSYYRGGNYYYTSQYGAQMLRDAVNNGYEEGFTRARLTDGMAGSLIPRTPTDIRMRPWAMTRTISAMTSITIISVRVSTRLRGWLLWPVPVWSIFQWKICDPGCGYR